ncbi:MAG: AAA family ATPase [Candidatus Electryonea clarkiae]|nr:AAA family ATPase [Candidatus Electryonea clarkiae]MDP8289035.1 AAA family ATPase [Candidatus Electryonea clarkiae]
MNKNPTSNSPPSAEQIQQDVQKFLREKYGADMVHAEVDSLGTKETSTTPKEEEELEIQFDMKPIELEKYLQEYVVQQDEAVEILATKVSTHFNRLRWERDQGKNLPKIPGQIKPNILMIGPTGVGKTYIIKLIADRLGVPFVKGDATKFSETGYVGGDVEDLVRDLVKVADGNIKLAETGIIYIDEIDKIAASQGLIGPDVSRTGVQRNLLKLMEETEVDLRVPHDLASQMEAVIETQRKGKAPRKRVNTRNILFIVSGAFNELEKIVERRMNRQPIGFRDEESKTEYSAGEILKHTSTQDLIEYGFESEFIGRLPVIAKLNELDADGLHQVLTNKYNAVTQGKIRDFAAYGIDLEFSKDTLKLLAEQAYEEKTGARGLTRVFERALIPFEKCLPSTRINKLRFTVEMTKNPREMCDDLVMGITIKEEVSSFKKKTGITLSISPAARNWLRDNVEDGKTPGDILKEKLESYEYGFSLLKRESLQVTVKMLENPKEYLENLIKKSYKK